MRLQELELVEEDASVYKLVGPLLVKQDLVEARANVGKRLEFITSERCAPVPPTVLLPPCVLTNCLTHSERLDNQLTALETRLGEKQKEIVAQQRRMQATPQAGAAVAPGTAAASG